MISLAQNKLQTLLRLSSFAAVFCLFCLTVGDVHAHFCLDGQEPAVSLHFESLNGHPDHSEDEQDHNDYEYEIETNTLQAKLTKFNKLNQSYLLSSASEVVLNPGLNAHFFTVQIYDFPISTKLFAILPFLRAPPQIS